MSKYPDNLQFHFRQYSKFGQFNKWAGTKNGELLRLAYEHRFAALITADKNMEYQQNHADIQIMVIVLIAHGNRLHDLQPLVAGILNILNHNLGAGIYRVSA